MKKHLPTYRSLRLWGKLRGLRHIHGHGIHSPFVYSLIQDVIEEKRGYYALDDIELLRKRLMQADAYREMMNRETINHKRGALLFRLANRFKPANLLHIGDTTGLPVLYTSSYASTLNIACVQSDPPCTHLSEWVFTQGAKQPVKLFRGTIAEQLPSALEWLKNPDLLFLDAATNENFRQIFTECLNHLHPESVVIINNINRDRQAYHYWKEAVACKEVSVSIDLTGMGILFFNKKLHKRNYTLYY